MTTAPASYSVQSPHCELIGQKRYDTLRVRAKAGALAELESLLEFRELVDEWKAEGVLMQAYTEWSDAMMIARDTLRRKMSNVRNYAADDLYRWFEEGAGFEHLETANTLAELAKKTPKQLMNEAVDLGDQHGKVMTVDQLTSHALGERKAEPALFRVNTILSRLGRFPLLLKWGDEKTNKYNQWLEAGREFFL